MLKVLLIIFLFFFVFIRLGGFIMKLLFSSFLKKQQTNAQQGYQRQQYKKPSDGNVNIDYVPKQSEKSDSNKPDFKGGDYVDYEDVK